MPAPLFLLIYSALLTTTFSYPHEVAASLACLLVLKLLRHC
jgi:hypothetical protein